MGHVDQPVSALDAALQDNRFILTAELTSPAAADTRSIARRAARLRGHVLAMNVPDGQAVSAHMAPLAAARLLLDAGVEPILTMQCRDRNRLALQSDLIGATALGVRNVLCLTGDAPVPGSAVPAVFDLDSVALLQTAGGLARGHLNEGRPLHTPPRLLLGAAAHPCAPSRHDRIDRLRRKVEAGARFVQTQYVFDVEGFKGWLAEVRREGLDQQVAILASVGPLLSPRMLNFVQQLPGVALPCGIRDRFAGLTAEDFAREGLRLCAETARALADLPGIAGIHIIAPYHEAAIPGILTDAGLAGRMQRA